MTTQNQPAISPEALMDAYQALKTQADTIKAQMDQIKTQLGELLPDGGTVGDHKVTHQRGRVSWTKVAKAYPETDFPQLYQTVTQLDQKTAEAQIAPAMLDDYRGEGTVVIR